MSSEKTIFEHLFKGSEVTTKNGGSEGSISILVGNPYDGFLFVFELSLFLKLCKINKCSFGILKFWKCNYKILTDFKKLVHNMRCIDFLTVSNRRNLSYQNYLHQICQIFKEALFIYSSELKEAYIYLYDITKIISNLFTSHIHRNDCKKVF